MTIATFVLFTGLVAFLTWWITRGKGTNTEDGFFLAGRSLTGLVIAGSLLLTNLSHLSIEGLKSINSLITWLYNASHQVS